MQLNLLPIFFHVLSLRIAAMECDKAGIASILRDVRVILGSRRHIGGLVIVVG
jgi:hypothetical protein